MSYVVIIEKRVEFETEHLGEAIAFKIGRRAGVLAKVLEASYTREELDIIHEMRNPPRKRTKTIRRRRAP